MADQQAPPKPYTIQEYLKLEMAAEERHEYVRGKLYAMAGGTRNHGLLGAGIVTELTILTRGTPCQTFNGDVKIRIDKQDCFLYPEASVVCGDVESSPLDKDSIINPMIVVEVLSPSTEAYDRGQKFMHYQLLSSLREYILIDQARPVVTTFYKNDQGTWETFTYTGLDAAFEIRTLDAKVEMKTLYEKVEGLGPVFGEVKSDEK